MASLLFTLASTLAIAEINLVVFAGASAGFSMPRNDGGKERKRHDLAEEQEQKARDQWNENRIKQLDFVNKRLREQNKARAYINNTDDAMLEYYRVFAKELKPFRPEPELPDFYHLLEAQRNGELLFATMDTDIPTYALYKYLK